MPKLTEGFAERIVVPAGVRDVQVFDDDLPGFGIRKFDSGRASYFVKFSVGQQQRRKTLGAVVRGNLKAMRLEASEILAKARLGTDVVAVLRATAAKKVTTLGALVPKYLEARKGELRPKSLVESTRYLERAWQPLHDHPIETITRQNIVSVIDEVASNSGKVAADRARMSLSALFGWAIDRGYAEANPTLHVRARAQSGGRSRVLSEAELIQVWSACLDDDHGRIVRLLILTGQRRGEIGDLAWTEVDLGRQQIALPEQRTKNGRPHIIPLSDGALSIIQQTPAKNDRGLVFGKGAGGFSGWSKAKAELDRRIAENASLQNLNARQLAPWTLHDIRRSFVTHVSERGFAAPHVVEAIVNHVSGHKGGVAGIYNRASYAAEKRLAMERWSAHITSLLVGNSVTTIA